MGVKRNLIIFFLVGLLALLGVGYFFLHSTPAKRAELSRKPLCVSPSPYQMRISFLQGGTLPSLITVRFFNGALQQKFLDRLGGGKIRQGLGKTKVKISSAFWREKIKFFYEKPGKQKKDLADSVTLKKAPAAKTLLFKPFSVYQALYILSKTRNLSPGGKLYAEMILDNRRIRSNRITIMKTAESDKTAFVRDANILYRLGDGEALHKRARAMTEKYPRYVPASWFLGLALEAKGEDDKALKAYLTTWKNLPGPQKRAFYEPPVLLWRHIRAVRAKKLSRNPAK